MGVYMENYKVTGFRPVNGIFDISSGFGENRTSLAQKLKLKRKTHGGIDFRCSVGTQVYAFLDGLVQLVGETDGFGYRIWLYHDLPGRANAIRSCYAHLSKWYVVPGQKIKQGELIGLSGGRPGDPGSGSSTGPHLHFETRTLPDDEPFEPRFLGNTPPSDNVVY